VVLRLEMLHRVISIGLVLLVMFYVIWMQDLIDDTSAGSTAGNTMCRNASQCGYPNGTKYSWCHIDYNGKWDYCCATQCDYGGKNYLWCSSGSQKEYLCGDAGTIDVNGRNCLPSHPCGLHHEEDKTRTGFFWCYVDISHTWGRCCHPNDTCTDKGQGFNLCYTGVMPNDSIPNCTLWEKSKRD
ncbi:hypothetical protein ACJMK2_001084, partial [Sinanodonta woodiana]